MVRGPRPQVGGWVPSAQPGISTQDALRAAKDFNPEGRTAAHKTLPLGMRLRVINPQNGRSIAVRINDRVPSTAKYPLDLSRGSARALGIKSVAAVALYQAR